MIAVCIDNSHTWRNVLTINKEYPVIKKYNDPHAGYPMVEVKCDDDEIRVYRANRFNLKEKQNVICAEGDAICMICMVGDDLENDQECEFDSQHNENGCHGFKCSEQCRLCPIDCEFLG